MRAHARDGVDTTTTMMCVRGCVPVVLHRQDGMFLGAEIAINVEYDALTVSMIR